MDCREASELLSAYHDGEVPPEIHAAVSAHVSGCPSCRRELDAFRAMSNLASRLDKPAVPDRWAELKPRLVVGQPPANKSRWSPSRRMLAAAAILVAVGFGMWSFWPHAGHQHVAPDFESFLRKLRDDPEGAEAILVTKYSGRRVSIPDAKAELGYKPVVAEGSPDGYALTDSYLLKMPCCTCLETIYRRPDGGRLCIFEHDGEQSAWFGHRPAIQTVCHGKNCRLVQADGFLAASWKSGPRYLTVVGARDIEEVARIVEELENPRKTF
jgi:hypothetical protein